MKKHLLFALSVVMYLHFSVQAQSQGVKQNTGNIQQSVIDVDGNTVPGFYPIVAKPIISSGNRAVTKAKIASSWNALTLLVSEANCLTANQATNTIMFTHRINKTWKATNVNSGFIQSTFSTNGGVAWDSLLDMQEVAPNFCRYPSGAIFNPAANTTPGSAFAVVSGPITDGTTPNGWKGNYFGSTQLNKTNNNKTIKLNATAGVKKQHFARIAIQATDTKVIVTGGLYGGEPDATTLLLQAYRGAMINYGVKSGNSFTWSVDSLKPSCKKPVDGHNYMYTQALTAWSKDGATGYVIFDGVDNAATNAELAFQPIVYKTTNGNAAFPTWTKMPITDFSAIPVINKKLQPSKNPINPTGPKKAWYSMNNGMDAMVDNTGNLHIVCEILSGSSTHADSLDYAFSAVNGMGYFYDTYTTSTGWNAWLIDSLRCIAASTSSPFQDSKAVKYNVDARIQASMSADGTHIFYLWMDSDPTAVNGENAIPDIFGRGWNISTSLSTPTKQFTNDGNNYYMFVSNNTLVSGSTYTVPATVSLSHDGSNNVDSTFDHYYVSGIQFVENEFTIPTPGGTVGINETVKNVAISQNYPNPFSKSTSIDVTLTETATVSIEVYNTIGQNVIVQNSEKLNAGTHTFTIDGSKLPAGIYFYTVKSGDTSVTRKMVVQ